MQDKQEKRECPAFDTFGSDLKAARNKLGYSRRILCDIINMDTRYLAHIENDGFIPGLALFYDLVNACNLPAAKYFNQALDGDSSTGSERRNSVITKVGLCPEKYLHIIEGALDSAINTKAKETESE